MQECIGKTCELGRGDLAFMLGSYCYSVSCSSDRVCQTIPAQPSKFYPRIAFLKWAPKINETELLEDEGADYISIPKCTRSHILYNHTLLGGLRAGNFTHLAEVDSIETCAALCCAEQTCDLALVLGENCYAGDCASKELCVPVPVKPTANRSSQIAYITSRKKVEEPGTAEEGACDQKMKPSDRFTMMNEGGNLKNGPMFLSDTESDSDDHDESEIPRRNRMPSIREPHSLKNPSATTVLLLLTLWNEVTVEAWIPRLEEPCRTYK
ncbi:hypothetical protein OS493_034618 [Desmophyllum pertusum]|uniref:Seven cysteines N-terminal domain-containing protein n=1 Tax=Desmophyllum pertusum TaxID=174260 RepID=A0A9W9ZIN6_9CNID|nr:hypothetical protein OS493_034618 [Desmophyllum pertusum]